ncbi:MAG: L,D-transpeptidase family protein [Mariprofundaceae bacterium]|nr:L,D-transpeptidase family protein [Mariprofundaceae bacterium]
MIRLSLWVLFFILPWAVQAAELSELARQRVVQALQDGTDPNVQSLSKNDILALKAVLALNEGENKRALSVLDVKDSKKDPLLVMLEAEAYRRSAVQSVESAGIYAKGMEHQKSLLKAANLSQGVREANVRLSLLVDKLDGVAGFPVDLLWVDPTIYSVFLVDKLRSRLFVYARNDAGDLVRVADEYVVTGAMAGDKHAEGDARTPNGIYRFSKRLQGKNLELHYGPVAYPIDYPNFLDVMHHKNGSGIWMHGYAEGVGRRPPRDTKGCFALPNSRLLHVSKYVKLGHSWVVVGQGFQFNEKHQASALLQSFRQSMEAWKKDWVSLDTEAYLKHYDQNFHSGHWNLALWKMHKRRVNASKSFVDVAISHLTMIHDPNVWPEGDVVVTDFEQRYQSDNYQDVTHKRMYWVRKKPHADWKILIEETL